MSKTFTYTKITGRYYLDYTDEWEEDGVDFEYEVDDDELLPEIVDLVFDDYFGDDKVVCDSEERTKDVKKRLKRLIEESDLIDIFADQYEDTLKEIFQDEAIDAYCD